MSALACPLCGQQVPATRQGMARHQRADGALCPPEAAAGLNTPAFGCLAYVASVVAGIGSTSWTVFWVCLAAASGAVVWKAGFSPAARVAAADRRAIEVVERAAAGAASVTPPARDIESEARQLLAELPPLGATIEDSIAACVARLRRWDSKPLEVRFTKLARAHVAADEWILGVATGPERGTGNASQALVIVTDRAVVVKDRDVVYRDEAPDTQPGEYGFLGSGPRVFTFSDNHGLDVALAAREFAAAKRRTVAVPSGRPPERLLREARDGELVAVEWMRYLGFEDAAATPVGADGGIDVTSARAVAQVKMEAKATGRPVVQQLHGVAVNEGKTGVFFSLAGYTPQARTWAQTSGTVLFRFDLQGAAEPVNALAHELLAAADARSAR
ncbi:restriction endonuclease [Streptomyces sp. NPDC057877]|uniref:restriction endonuclease n=1 Tax=Streptomyces sp. NPDC057877 TaxID=3346269 RepID=UPI0036A3612C